jgi:hypothetical protein
MSRIVVIEADPAILSGLEATLRSESAAATSRTT